MNVLGHRGRKKVAGDWQSNCAPYRLCQRGRVDARGWAGKVIADSARWSRLTG